MADNELGVRQLRKPDKHPTTLATYAALPVGGPDGLRYRTVHQRRRTPVLEPLDTPKPPFQQAIR
jgi:hypothetical protein